MITRDEALHVAAQAAFARHLISDYEQGPPVDLEAREQDLWRAEVVTRLAHEVPRLIAIVDTLEHVLRAGHE